MSGFEGVVGHERSLRVILKAISSGRAAHAYLFWGPEGIGKELVARSAAKLLLCKNENATKIGAACGVCDSCRKCEATEHPDLHILAPGDKAISVDNVRALQETLSFEAFERGRKIAIIRDAFRMSREGANALLKTVEEPPAETYIFLLAHHRSQLLPTLVSRCQPLRFDPLLEEEVRGVLSSKGVVEADADILAGLSGGSAGMALAQDLAALEEIQAEVLDIAANLENFSPAKKLSIAESWARSKEDLPLRLDTLERAWQGLAKNDDNALRGLERLFNVRALIDRNVNLQLALDALFLLTGDTGWSEIS